MRKVGNPVLLREMRARAKGKRGFVVHILFLTFFLLIFLPSYYFVLREETPWAGNDLVFTALLVSLLCFTAVASPAFSSGSITGEREQKTLAFLLVLPLKPETIVSGKILSSFFFSALLLTTTLPFLFLAFTVGGIDGRRFLLAFILILISSLFFSALGLFFSSLSKRTASATAITYGVIIALLFGTLALESYLASRHPRGGGLPHLSGVFYLNPLMGLLSILSGKEFDMTVGETHKSFTECVPYKFVPLPLWVVNILLLLIFTFILGLLTIRRLRKMERS
ncbi:MAG: ABC transporter permease [bacterium]